MKFDLDTKSIIKKLPLDQKIYEMTYSDYINSFIFVGKDNKVTLIEKNEFKLSEILQLNEIEHISNIDISNDGKTIFFSQKSILYYYNLFRYDIY